MSLQEEIKRKLFHILILILPISYSFLTKKQILSLLIPFAVIVVLADFYRHKFIWLNNITNQIFAKIMRPRELEGGLSGLSFTLIAASIVFSFAPKIVALNAFTILAISDSAASILGKRIKSDPFFEKTVVGSIVFAACAVVIVAFYGLLFNEGFLYYIFALAAVFAATIIEARPSLLGADDNLTIPLTFFAVIMLFSIIWNYQY